MTIVVEAAKHLRRIGKKFTTVASPRCAFCTERGGYEADGVAPQDAGYASGDTEVYAVAEVSYKKTVNTVVSTVTYRNKKLFLSFVFFFHFVCIFRQS